jgi:hypothetical protein
MGTTKSKRHGSIKVLSGDTTPLEKTLTFTEGDFEFTINRNITDLLDRGTLTEFRKGDDTPVEWSFSGKFRDRSLMQVFDEFVFDGTTETIAGLTAAALNSNVPTTKGLGYKQGTLFVTDAGHTKLALGATPAVAGEYAENAGVVDSEGVTVATTFDIFQAVGDTTVAIFYGAVGKSDTPEADCSDVKTLLIHFLLADPCNPSVTDETYVLAKSARTEITIAEGDEFDTVSISGKSLITRPDVLPAGPPP